MTEAVENKTSEKDEIALLKERADKLGVKYSPNIGIDTLRQRVNDAMEGKSLNEDEVTEPKPEKKAKVNLRQSKYNEAMRLRRVRIQLMNTKKSELPGELFTVSNDIIGTVKKFIPYDSNVYVDGYHVPQCILNFLENKKFLFVKTIKDRTTGRERTETSFIKEFAIEYLPDLTKEELKELAATQAARKSVD